jgi:membrane protein involved in colicin uptake
MTDETPAKTGDAAWKEQRDAVSERNAEARKRAQGDNKQKAGVAAAKVREDAKREAEQLRDLNVQIAKRGSGGAR